MATTKPRHADQPVEAAVNRMWVVHRLDKETSGVIVFARSAEVHRALNIAFDSREVSKVYHAIVIGVPPWNEHLIDLPLRPNGDRRHRTVIDRERQPAVTCVLERFAHTDRSDRKPARIKSAAHSRGHLHWRCPHGSTAVLIARTACMLEDRVGLRHA
jgi:23S rRNA-/tRNA-specific pseudouridylate synthase